MKVFKYNIDTLAEWNKKPHPYANAAFAVFWLIFTIMFYNRGNHLIAGMGIIVTILCIKDALLDIKAIREKR